MEGLLISVRLLNLGFHPEEKTVFQLLILHLFIYSWFIQQLNNVDIGKLRLYERHVFHNFISLHLVANGKISVKIMTYHKLV